MAGGFFKNKRQFFELLLLDILLAFMLTYEYRERFGTERMVESTVELTGENGAAASEVTANGDGEEAVLKRIALTFDDGPHPVYTPMLLDGLRERGIHATFFLMGQNAEEYPEIVKTMYEDGHLIGNHTYSHMQLTAARADAFVEELQRTDELIFSLTGEHTEFVRPPYGVWDSKYEKTLSMLPVLWTIDPLDWCTSNTDTVINRVVKKAKENGIILLHDSYKSSVEAALRIVDILIGEGYEFVTVDEIILE